LRGQILNRKHILIYMVKRRQSQRHICHFDCTKFWFKITVLFGDKAAKIDVIFSKGRNILSR